VVVGTPKGEVLAFEASAGRETWKARVSSEVLAAPAVADGLAIVRSGDSRIFAFDAADGKRRWVYQRSTPSLSLRSNVGVLPVGKVTLAGFPGGKLVAIANNNGAAVWEVTVALPKGATELERVADVTSSPAISGSMVCAAAFQGRAACFDSNTGNTLWSRDMSSSTGLDIDNRYVYVTDDKGAVHALDRNSGASIWKQDKLARRSLSRPLALGRTCRGRRLPGRGASAAAGGWRFCGPRHDRWQRGAGRARALWHRHAGADRERRPVRAGSKLVRWQPLVHTASARAPARMKPTLVIVGRPNVGKSTLFNRLTRSRDALVADQPGLTRDRHYGHGRLGNKPYLVVDTGGFEPQAKEGIVHEMARQAEAAIAEADVLIFLVDVRTGLAPRTRSSPNCCAAAGDRCCWPRTRARAWTARWWPRSFTNWPAAIPA
jgi:hypothetical protein